MRLTAVLEANEVVDRHYRRTADQTFRTIYELIERSYRTTGDWPKGMIQPTITYSYVLKVPLRMLPMELQADLHGNRYVAVILSNASAVGGGEAEGMYARLADGKMPAVFLSAFSDHEAVAHPMGEFPIPEILKTLKRRKRIMVHEIIHWMDDNRYGLHNDTKGERETARLMSGETDDPTGYYNSANEWNAHYQELVHSIEGDIQDEKVIFNPQFSDIGKLTSSFQMFYRGIKAMYTKRFEFLEYMTPVTERKFRKRLYNFFNETARPILLRTHG